MHTRYKLVTTLVVLVSFAAAAAYADPASTLASDNATVQPGGPRSGSSGKAYFNMEGSVNGTYASYGVADFNFGILPYPVLGVNSAELALTQANAAYSASGNLVLSVDQSATLVDIQPGTSPLAFDGVDPGTATDVTEGDLSLLSLGAGPFTYTIGANGDVDHFALTLDSATEAEIVNRLNNQETIRIVVGTGEAGVAATYAGYTNYTYAGPTLNLDLNYDKPVPAGTETWGRIKALFR